MTDYSLAIEIDRGGLQTLDQSRQQIAIVQLFVFPPVYPVVWIAIPPIGKITVQWTDITFVYYSTDRVVTGKRLGIDDSLQATPGSIYQFAEGQLSQAPGTVRPDEFQIENKDRRFNPLTTGLARKVKASGSSLSPLNAATTPFNEKGVYSPREAVQVFAASGICSGRVLSPSFLSGEIIRSCEEFETVVSRPLTIDLSKDASRTIHYDDSNNSFAVGPLASRANRAGVG